MPEFGRFIDAPAIFRGKRPGDTAEMQKLQGDERQVKVSVMYEDGQVSPEGSKVVWPFRCKRR